MNKRKRKKKAKGVLDKLGLEYTPYLINTSEVQEAALLLGKIKKL